MFSANALVERLDFDGATEMLMANLYDGRLTPESPLWRESLFELGNLQYRRGDILQLDAKKLADQGADATLQIQKLEESFQQFQVGIKRLEEALARFGDDPRGLQTRYLVAQAYRFASQLPDTELKMNRVVVEDKRRQRCSNAASCSFPPRMRMGRFESKSMPRTTLWNWMNRSRAFCGTLIW